MVTGNLTSEEIKAQFEHIKNWLIGELSQQKNANATMTSKKLPYDGEFDLRDELSKKDLAEIKDNLYDILMAMRAMDMRTGKIEDQLKERPTGKIEDQLKERPTSTPNFWWWLITVAATAGATIMPDAPMKLVWTLTMGACGVLIDVASNSFNKRNWRLLELMSSNNNTEPFPFPTLRPKLTLTSKNATNNTESVPTVTSKNATNNTKFSPSPTPAPMPTAN